MSSMSSSSCHLYCGCSFCWHHLVIIVVIIVKVISKVTDKNSFIPPLRHHYHRYLHYDHYHLTLLSPLSSLSWLSQRSEVQRPTFHGPSPGNGYNAQRSTPSSISSSLLHQLTSFSLDKHQAGCSTRRRWVCPATTQVWRTCAEYSWLRAPVCSSSS